MKKILFVLTVAITVLFAADSGFSQYISDIIPEEDRTESIEVIELQRKIRKAKDLIEEKGEVAFLEFHKEGNEWVVDMAIYVVEATEGDEKHGEFVVYPKSKNVGQGALHMPSVNGRHFAREALKSHKKGKESWFSFIADEKLTEPVPHANTVAVAPSGRIYALTAGNNNLAREKLFLKNLVNSACDLVAKEGVKAFDTFRDKNSVFRFGDTYIFVLDKDANFLLDPGHPEYEGKNVTDLPSIIPGYVFPTIGSNFEEALENVIFGKFPNNAEGYMKQRQSIFLKNGRAWVAYLTAKPGQKEVSRKVSFIKMVKGPDGKDYQIGSGVYLADPIVEKK